MKVITCICVFSYLAIRTNHIRRPVFSHSTHKERFPPTSDSNSVLTCHEASCNLLDFIQFPKLMTSSYNGFTLRNNGARARLSFLPQSHAFRVQNFGFGSFLTIHLSHYIKCARQKAIPHAQNRQAAAASPVPVERCYTHIEYNLKFPPHYHHPFRPSPLPRPLPHSRPLASQGRPFSQ